MAEVTTRSRGELTPEEERVLIRDIAISSEASSKEGDTFFLINQRLLLSLSFFFCFIFIFLYILNFLCLVSYLGEFTALECYLKVHFFIVGNRKISS